MSHQLFLDATMPHLDLVWSIARRMSADPAGAEDLVQETYARAWRGFANQGRGDVRSWLVAICLNVGRSELRRGLRSPRITPGFDEAPDAPSAVDVSGDALASLDREAVAQALAALPLVQRRAIVLVDIGGLSAREAAEIERAPRGTILARVHRGRRRLARRPAQHRRGVWPRAVARFSSAGSDARLKMAASAGIGRRYSTNGTEKG